MIRQVWVALTLIMVVFAIWLFTDNSSKILTYKKLYSAYYHNHKFSLQSRFSKSQLLAAINHAQQQTWVQQQIAADLSVYKHGISAADVNLWFMQLIAEQQHHDLIKFTIRDNEIYVDNRSDRSYIAAYDTIYEIIQILTQYKLLADCEFILALSDFLVYIPENLRGKDIPVFTFAKHMQIPTEQSTILVPDWVNVRYSDQMRHTIKFANRYYPWNKKRNIVHWRGGPADSMLHRQQLVALTAKLNYIDAAMTQGNNAAASVAPELSIENKYQIALDGARCTWSRIIWQMHANTILLKPNSPQVQWFYKGLRPYQNFVPLTEVNSASLSTVYDWLQNNDAIARRISEQANMFAEDNFKTQDLIAYYYLVLHEYAKLYRH